MRKIIMTVIGILLTLPLAFTARADVDNSGGAAVDLSSNYNSTVSGWVTEAIGNYTAALAKAPSSSDTSNAGSALLGGGSTSSSQSTSSTAASTAGQGTILPVTTFPTQ